MLILLVLDEMSKLTPSQIENLPNILQVLDILQEAQDDFVDSGSWYSRFPDLCATANALGCECSYSSYCNPYEPDDFLVSRLNSKRYCFKPNLVFVPFLCRGEREEFPSVISAFERKDSAERLISNLKTMDFVRFVRTHPLCRMFDDGIKLESYSKTFFFETNYYGLAQHYNFNTGLIDFSSNKFVAAFFATTINKGSDIYEPIEDTTKYPYGVIYLHKINPCLTFNIFSTIGQQIFPRTGAQLGFFYQEKNSPFDVNKLISKIYFKHDAECSKKIFEMMDKGKRLFPKDELIEVSELISKTDRVSLVSFAENLYTNPGDTMDKNLGLCESKGIKVDPNLNYHFTPEMLRDYFNDITNNRWEEFCKPIYFCCKNGEKLKEELLALPKDGHYKQYFDLRYYERLFYHSLEKNFVRSKALKDV